MPLWDVEVFFDGRGDMYLGGGRWKEFVSFYDLRQVHALVFRYGGHGDLVVTVFDHSTCRKEGTRAGRGSSLPIPEPSQFAVTLRQGNLEAQRQNQYLNVPKDFRNAQGYMRRRRVVLQMGGRSWLVNLKHGRRPPRSSFKYGWYQFCIDNSLEVGDVCFFQVIYEGSGGFRRDDYEEEEDEEWEHEEEDDKQLLKVEVRKKNGRMVS